MRSPMRALLAVFSLCIAWLATGCEKADPLFCCTIREACLRPGLPLAVCTIYNGCFPDPSYQRLASVALMVFNDVILRTAISHGLQVIDLRAICSRAEDYANPIEPSSIGGEKIARAIVALVTDATVTARGARIVAR